MLLIIEIGLTIAVCILWAKSGRGWAWGCLPGGIVGMMGLCIGINIASSGRGFPGITSIPVWPDILAIIALTAMLLVGILGKPIPPRLHIHPPEK
jgi:hypothetical protein